MEPPRSAVGNWPVPPAPAVPGQPGAPVAGFAAAPPASVPQARGSWPAGDSRPPAPPPVSGQPAAQPSAGQPPAGQPAPATWSPGQAPSAAAPFPGAVPPGAAAGRQRGGWLPRAALLLALLLVLVSGLQAYQIHLLNGKLEDTRRDVATTQDRDRLRLDGLEQRTEELEKQAGTVFNPEEIADAVLRSVFRVRAGQATGTAFAVGKSTADGGTNLFTNYHVVQSVWETGQRQVFLERTDQRFPATIVRVDPENDVAHLRATASFTGLVAAATPVKSGQQIVVVGAPLGLTDSVTTGVVSAFRKAENGSSDMIQFDAPINPGNSGGPVINGAKQVVGIATAKARDAEGIGLAVPIKVACDVFDIC